MNSAASRLAPAGDRWAEHAVCAKANPDWWSVDGAITPANKKAARICITQCPVRVACRALAETGALNCAVADGEVWRGTRHRPILEPRAKRASGSRRPPPANSRDCAMPGCVETFPALYGRRYCGAEHRRLEQNRLNRDRRARTRDAAGDPDQAQVATAEQLVAERYNLAQLIAERYVPQGAHSGMA